MQKPNSSSAGGEDSLAAFFLACPRQVRHRAPENIDFLWLSFFPEAIACREKQQSAEICRPPGRHPDAGRASRGYRRYARRMANLRIRQKTKEYILFKRIRLLRLGHTIPKITAVSG
jgi:hypothetical protein